MLELQGDVRRGASRHGASDRDREDLRPPRQDLAGSDRSPQAIKDTEDHYGPALTNVLWHRSLTENTNAGLKQGL